MHCTWTAVSRCTVCLCPGFVYDRTTGEWHEETYAANWPVAYVNVPGLVFGTTGPGYALVDTSPGKIYYQGPGYPSDGGTAITYTGVTPAIADAGKTVKHPLLEIQADIGTAQITLEASNDGGTTFPISRAAISGSAETGHGRTARFRWRQLGTSRNRAYRYTITTSTELVRIAGADIGISPGSEP